MSVLAALAKRWHYSVKNPGAGKLLYREGNHEYTFPIYPENGELVLVGVPSSQRIHLFFTSYAAPREFSAAARDRILPRIREHLQSVGLCVRVFDGGGAGEDFAWYPELFEHRARAGELLEAAGCTWFQDYSAIDPLHAEYGLEVCGIHELAHVQRIAEALAEGFPHWHHQSICRNEPGREPGWTVALSMFPSRVADSDWCDED